MPATNGFYTKGHYVQLQPYSTTTYEYFFYFPQPGDFTHYPVHVARNGRMIASAAPVTLKAVKKLTKIDTESWEYVSQNGSNEQVLAFRYADASVLAPFSYTQLLWVSILGFITFGEVPDIWTVTGAAFIVASGLYTAHRERIRRSQLLALSGEPSPNA